MLSKQLRNVFHSLKSVGHMCNKVTLGQIKFNLESY